MIIYIYAISLRSFSISNVDYYSHFYALRDIQLHFE